MHGRSQDGSTQSASEVVERYFAENRARLIEIAAFLDRVDRAEAPEAARADFRYRALLRAVRLVVDRDGDRTVAVHRSFSDPTTEPLASASDAGPACGAYAGDAS